MPQPALHLRCEPTNTLAIDTTDRFLRGHLITPPEVRPDGFGFRGVDRVRPTSFGCEGTGYAGHHIKVYDNGNIELTCPLDNSQFQWYREESGFNKNWLFPYTVAEIPITFVMLIHEIFTTQGYSGGYSITQNYNNLSGYILVPGHPAGVGFGIPRNSHIPANSDIIGRPVSAAVECEPQEVGYDLAFQVYDHFGHTHLPKFEEFPIFRHWEVPFNHDYFSYTALCRSLTSNGEVVIRNEIGDRIQSYSKISACRFDSLVDAIDRFKSVVWDSSRDIVKFRLAVEDTVYSCAISYEALTDNFGNGNPVSLYWTNRERIETKALNLINDAHFEGDGSILVRSKNFTE